jgi:deoxyribonuclease V
MHPKRNHRWDVTPDEAVALQEQIRPHLILRGGPRWPRTIAGADVAYDEARGRCFAAVVVMSVPAMQVVEQVTAECPISFPYLPGLLAFREGPPLLEAFAKLRRRPDLIMFDGQGIAHPRRCGLASHLGYLLDVPSIGCAKSLFVGRHATLEERAGSAAGIIHRDEWVGAAIRTRAGVRPVYVSQGYRVASYAAIALTLRTVTRYRVPQPLRLAGILAQRCKREALTPA